MEKAAALDDIMTCDVMACDVIACEFLTCDVVSCDIIIFEGGCSCQLLKSLLRINISARNTKQLRN